MTKTFPEVISGIRTAKKGVEVREDIAQMGEYVEQFAATATQKAKEAAASEKKASDAVANIDQQKADSVAAVQQAQTTATTTITGAKDAALTSTTLRPALCRRWQNPPPRQKPRHPLRPVLHRMPTQARRQQQPLLLLLQAALLLHPPPKPIPLPVHLPLQPVKPMQKNIRKRPGPKQIPIRP